MRAAKAAPATLSADDGVRVVKDGWAAELMTVLPQSTGGLVECQKPPTNRIFSSPSFDENCVGSRMNGTVLVSATAAKAVGIAPCGAVVRSGSRFVSRHTIVARATADSWLVAPTAVVYGPSSAFQRRTFFYLLHIEKAVAMTDATGPMADRQRRGSWLPFNVRTSPRLPPLFAGRLGTGWAVGQEADHQARHGGYSWLY